jgi:hypothetical protein
MLNQIFVSYSHDNDDHKAWVLQLATRLRSNSVDIILDQWHLNLGSDLAAFMEQGLSKSRRVLCICSEKYIEKANSKLGGVGYEKQIITSELMNDLNSDWVIPVIKNNPSSKKLPIFIAGRLYVDFENELLYEKNYEELLRNLVDEPVLPIPPLGPNPFKADQFQVDGKFIPSSEKYVSPSTKGKVTFDYSNNNGLYSIGQGTLLFELKFSKSSDRNIQLLNDPATIYSVAIVKDKEEISEVDDARNYDGSSRVRRPNKSQIAVLRNSKGFFAAIKILDIKDDTRGPDCDEVTFEYVIQTNGTPDFTV